MANFSDPDPFAPAQGTDTSQGYNMAATAWPDYSGASQLQFAQMLGIPQHSGGWYQNQGGFSDVWFPSQGGFTDASMIAALNAKLQASPDIWIQQMMAQAGASQSQMLQQQIMQRQMAQSGTAPQSESVSKGGQAKSPGMTPMAPPGISSTTPLKAGSNVAVPGDKSGPKAPSPTPAMSSERTPNEAGAKAGQLLLNLVNNKEEAPPAQGAGAALLQQLKGGGKKPDGQGHNDHGAGMALLQQVKNGAEKGSTWTGEGGTWWNRGKTSHYEADWEDWGHGKVGKKGKSDRGAWSGDWWSYGQDWSEEGHWPERWAPSAPQWGRQNQKKGGKAKASGRQASSQESSEGSNDSDSSNQPQAGANSRWRQRKPNEKGAGRGKGQPADGGKTRWKPAAGKSNGK